MHFLPEFPKKLVENDGRKLARHIKNRGRPTEQTWQKYRESKRHREVLAGNLKLNMKLGVFFSSLNIWRVILVPKMLFEASGAIFWSPSFICLKVRELQQVLSIKMDTFGTGPECLS